MQIQEITHPIRNMTFQGLHWIEASAGTGKTFTLSSLMVRILLEKYLPRQIIATTFTRKAAAELKSRIRQRLYQVLMLLESIRDQQVSVTQQQAETETDELIQIILQRHAHQIGYACDRLQLVLDQLDELFVGTLDSFSQNLLREFAFESGKIERAEITADESSYIRQLVHDHLRAWLAQQPQSCVNLLLQREKLKSIDAYVDLIAKSLNFSSAKLTEITPADFDLNAVQQAYTHLRSLDLSTAQQLQPFTDQGFGAKMLLQPWSIHSIVDVIQVDLPQYLDEVDRKGIEHLLSTEAEVLKKLKKFIDKPDPRNAAGKKKIAEDQLDLIVQHPIFCALTQLFDALHDAQNKLDDLAAYLRFYIAQQAKIGLPQLLQNKGETTFNQQIRTLAEALQGEQGEKFSAFVHARYPLILVDEFQDTNLDQDNMLAAIWRQSQRLQQGCMIMVGDRKQAIYGFRGGDMLTFLKARQDVYVKQGQFYQLTKNFRSIAPLVEAVDALFQCQPDFGEDVHYVPITAGAVHADLYDAGAINPSPLRWLQLNNPKDEAAQVAWQIQHLLSQSAQDQLYFQKKSADHVLKTAVTANDIAVLASSHAALNAVQKILLQQGIAVDRASKRSVFSSEIAIDVAAMLSAILMPYHEAKVKRAVLGRLIGLKLEQLWQAGQQQLDLSQYIAQFEHIRELWMNRGFLAAWHYSLHYFKIWERLVALPHRNNERDVVNLRHLTELLSQQSEKLQGAQHLYQWYFKQLNRPKEQEWDLERPLTSAEGVKLMTIHQSKGLEFKFVFLLNADGNPKNDNDVFFSTEDQPLADGGSVKHRVINVSGQVQQHEKEQTEARRLAEQHRLWYVALTRASYRIYAVLRTLDHKSKYSLPFWRNVNGVTFEHAESMLQPLLDACPEKIERIDDQQQLGLQAFTLPEQQFYPRRNTSFTALSQHLSYRQPQDQLAVQQRHEDSAEDEQDAIYRDLAVAQPLSWIKLNFPKGTVAGTFLHSIYEHLDFQAPETWGLEILRRFKNDGPQLLVDLRKRLLDDFELQPIFIRQWKDLYLKHTEHLHADALQQIGTHVTQHEQHKYLRAAYLQFNRELVQQMLQQQDTIANWQGLFQHAADKQTEQFEYIVSELKSSFATLSVEPMCVTLAENLANIRHHVLLDEPKPLSFYQTIGLISLTELVLNDVIYALMAQWIQEVVTTPLHEQFSLSQLSLEQHLPEFSFQLSLADHPVAVKRIQQLFDANEIKIEALNEANTARYLVGAIDLVYFDGQRYHIADYKSNFLGLTEAEYRVEPIRMNMSQSSYWLQAALYLVAMHRYLQCSMHGYRIEQHLGGASYLYLRGMQGLTDTGCQYWKPSDDFILKLDEILGQYAVDNLNSVA